MKNKSNKRGELTTQQLVMIIILVLSFAIILFFIFRLGLGKTTDREICHDSIVKKSSPVLGKLSGEFNCKTTNTCISGGGKCNDLTAENTISVDANNKDEIFKAIADEMADCWWMFGEGKLDYIGANAASKKTCAVCSYIAFDDKIKNLYSEGISYKEFLDNLAKPMNIQKNNDNYLYYLYGISNLNSLSITDPTWREDYDKDEKISLQGKFVIMTGMSKIGIFGKFFRLFTAESNTAYLAPEFPFRAENASALQCDNFLTKGT